MPNTHPEASYKTYWATWFLLLALTLVMVFIAQAALSKLFTALLLLLAMFIKASLIGAYFMHLRFERASLALTVLAGIFFTSAALFLLIAPDGIRILQRLVY